MSSFYCRPCIVMSSIQSMFFASSRLWLCVSASFKFCFFCDLRFFSYAIHQIQLLLKQLLLLLGFMWITCNWRTIFRYLSIRNDWQAGKRGWEKRRQRKNDWALMSLNCHDVVFNLFLFCFVFVWWSLVFVVIFSHLLATNFTWAQEWRPKSTHQI